MSGVSQKVTFLAVVFVSLDFGIFYHVHRVTAPNPSEPIRIDHLTVHDWLESWVHFKIPLRGREAEILALVTIHLQTTTTNHEEGR